MDRQNNPNSRNRKRSPKRVFKEIYLPIIIGCVTALMVLIFLVSALIRGIQRIQYNIQLSREASVAAQAEQDRLTQEAELLLSDTAELAAHFDYKGALAQLETFSGNMADFPALQDRYQTYTAANDELVLWEDIGNIPNLSFHPLIVDSARAFADPVYGTSYNRNFVTVSEFQSILQQLYENDYILISLADITTGTENKELYLPAGKKPLILTETNVNYYTYMQDGNGAGFASRLTEDANGNITCEYVTADGQTVTGPYDIIPILESFIETHPDFSYKNARAVIAVTGYDGILGYRTNPAAAERLGQDAYVQQLTDAAYIADRLESMGYELACYTYGNEPYGNFSAQQIQTDLTKWDNEVTPVSSAFGTTRILVFAQNNDIHTPSHPYSGDKFQVLQSHGFTHYLGLSNSEGSWFYSGDGYIRQGRLLVTGSNLTNHAAWFEGLFDAATVLDNSRGDIPA